MIDCLRVSVLKGTPMMPICSELFWPGLRTHQGNTRAARPEPCAAGFVCPAGTSNRTGAADGAAAEEAPVAEEGAELPGACSDFSWVKEASLTQSATMDILECFIFIKLYSIQNPILLGSRFHPWLGGLNVLCPTELSIGK